MRIKKRVLVPGLLVLLGGGLFIRDLVRTRPSAAPDPSDAAESVHCAVRRLPDGTLPVRCALVLNSPREQVWSVITDYDHYTQIFPYLTECSGARLDDTRYHLTAVASSPLYLSWPFTATISHSKNEPQWKTTWNDASGKITTERGSWTLTALDANRTLLAYTLELRIKHVPVLLLDNILLDNLPKVLRAVKTHLAVR